MGKIIKLNDTWRLHFKDKYNIDLEHYMEVDKRVKGETVTSMEWKVSGHHGRVSQAFQSILENEVKSSAVNDMEYLVSYIRSIGDGLEQDKMINSLILENNKLESENKKLKKQLRKE